MVDQDRKEISTSIAIEDWAKINLQAISQAMENQRQRQLKERPESKSLDPSKRWLSEMNLCEFLQDPSLKPPGGWEIVSGSVSAYDDPVLRSTRIGHTFLVNKTKGLILDFHFAQFLGPFNERLERGDRVRFAQQRVPFPGMIKILDGGKGTAYISGSKEMVESALHLDYEY